MNMCLGIACDNAAFDPDLGGELGRILDGLASKLRNSDPVAGQSIVLRDSNGNTVGHATFIEESA